MKKMICTIAALLLLVGCCNSQQNPQRPEHIDKRICGFWMEKEDVFKPHAENCALVLLKSGEYEAVYDKERFGIAKDHGTYRTREHEKDKDLASLEEYTYLILESDNGLNFEIEVDFHYSTIPSIFYFHKVNVGEDGTRTVDDSEFMVSGFEKQL